MSTNEPVQPFRALVEQVADAIIFADREGRILVWNAGAEAVFGYSAGEVLGRHLDVVIPERFRGAHWVAFDRAVAAGEIRHGREAMTTRSARKDGADLYVDLSFALVKDDAGEVLGAVAVARDITGRYMEERESRRRLAELEAEVKALSFRR